MQPVEGFKSKRLRFSEEAILRQDCNVEILPEFSTCWYALQISDSRLLKLGIMLPKKNKSSQDTLEFFP